MSMIDHDIFAQMPVGSQEIVIRPFQCFFDLIQCHGLSLLMACGRIGPFYFPSAPKTEASLMSSFLHQALSFPSS